ncbi:MAG: antibiotic biosynthesis monooxygenase [Chitinophagales bacterium]|nr:antibiotic biosynthesis monooxygenase [Chitinophagales bacterium]
MIIRIVKLTFQPDRVDDFTGIFNKEKATILSFDGCKRVELWEDTDRDNVFFTYSEWRDKQALEDYRNSAFFKATWARAKTLFADKPNAWSVAVVDA